MSTQQQTQPQPQTPDARKVGSDGEDFSDTVNEITNFEVWYGIIYFYYFILVLGVILNFIWSINDDTYQPAVNLNIAYHNLIL